MTRALVFDTETTGLPLFDQPSEDPRQPHIVELAARLVDIDSRKTISSLSVVVQPDGWTIPESVTQVHGITQQHAEAVGVPEMVALEIFMALWARCDVRVAHNVTFDDRIIRIALKRFGGLPDAWKAGAADCTARLSTPILNLPPTAKMVAAKRNGPKTPNLAEAYEFFTGAKLEGAHSARVDVNACAAIYFAIMDRESA
jgi:DNA polymerase-3 subunit epsilon